MVINKISDDFVSDNDDNVKVGDVATITKVDNEYEYDTRLENPNWELDQNQILQHNQLQYSNLHVKLYHLYQ